MTRAEALAALTAPGEPYELCPQPLYGHTCNVFVHAPATLRQLFEDARSDAEFIVFGDERLSYEAAWQRASQIGHVLVHELGVVPGDRVAISMRNYPEWILTFMAATSVGAIAVAMNALWQPEELGYALQDSAPKVLFADAERLERLAACSSLPNDLTVIAVRSESASESTSEAPHQLDAMLRAVTQAQGTVDMPPCDLHPDDDATIFYTSGSTGHPKGAVSRHRNILSALMSWELDLRAGLMMRDLPVPEPEEQPATLLAVPLFHVTGSHAVFLASYRAQRRIVAMYKWDVAEAARLIEAERISSVIAPAAMTGDLVKYALDTDADLSSLVSVGGGGAPRAPEQVRSIERTFANALPGTGWGMTETNAIGTGIGGVEYLERPESSGRCSAVLELRVLDEEGNPLGTGERGELQIRGTSIIRGYWNRPDANAETFDDGWLKTGDVAYLDEDGFLFIVDRLKDLVIRGGENIGCGTVEAALWEHPLVREASVYAVPDERLGEEVGATVYAAASLSEDELRTFLAPKLARFEVPRYIHITDEPLPRTASGKILKRQLRDEARERWVAD